MADPISTATPTGQVTAAEQANLNSTGGGQSSATFAAQDPRRLDSPIPTVVVTAPPPGQQAPLANPLHDYDSYTYCLSLHLLNIGDFNRLVESSINGAPAIYTPQNVLVSSAGRWGANFVRNAAFTEDFYFDNFRMSTVINTTQRNRSSNAIECSFTLIEPNGFTFLNRLIDAAIITNGSPGNYLKMPYVLQIDFFGYKDGEIQGLPIPGQTKVIPITLIDLKSKNTHKGTEYSIRAVPYNHQAFNQSNVVSPADFLIKAKTVADVFGSGAVTATTMVAQMEAAAQQANLAERYESALSERLAAAKTDAEKKNIQEQYNTLKNSRAAQSSGSFKVSGFADAMNSWWAELQARKSVVSVNHINVVFHPDIGEKQLYPSDAVVPVQQVAGTSNSNQSQKEALQAAGGAAKNKVSFNASTMSVPAGTSIDTLIDWAVRNSDYIRAQLKDPTAATGLDPNADNSAQLKSPLRWYKVVPQVKITSYDVSTSSYTMDITYYVKPWTVNSKHPMGPLGKVNGWVKEYNYMYTGQNKDIVDLQIDFNMMFFQPMTADRNKGKDFGTAKVKGDPSRVGENDGNPNGRTDIQQTGAVVVPQSRVQPIPVVYSTNNIKYQTRSGGNQAAAQTAGDIKESLMLDSRGDMITLKMRILGDPHFIKQDDVFYNTGVAPGQGQLTPNGSLWTDDGELYVYITFRSPTDYDEATGLAIPANSQYNRSEWSGIYRIIKVENDFTKGKFEQVLELARLPLSDIDINQNSTAQSRLDTLSIIAIGQASSFAASRFSGPSILQSQLNGLNPANTPQATLQSGASAIQSLITSAIAQATSAAVKKITASVTKSVTDAAQPYLDTVKREANELFGTTDPKFVEGSDTFVGPTAGNGGGIDYTNAVDESAAETARLAQANDAVDSLNTDVIPPGTGADAGIDYGVDFANIPDAGFSDANFGGFENLDF